VLTALHGCNGIASFCKQQKLGCEKNYMDVIFFMPPLSLSEKYNFLLDFQISVAFFAGFL